MNKGSFLICFILFIITSICYAQSENQVYARRLVWSADEHVWRYAVEIDKADNGVYSSFLREFTILPNILIYLTVGEYRFRIIPYDILDRPGEETQWMYFDVRLPVVRSGIQTTDETETAQIQEIVIEDTPPVIEEPMIEIPELSAQEAARLYEQYAAKAVLFNLNGHRYDVIDETMTWEEARHEAQRRGGYLATITSAEEQRFINQLIRGRGKNVYWLGGQRIGNHWMWITGEGFEYRNWAPGQPDNYLNNQDKILIMRVVNPFIENSHAGQWDDENENNIQEHKNPAVVRYTNQKGFIIEYPAREGEEKIIDKNVKPIRNPNRYNTIGASIGTAFTDPLVVVSLHGSFSPFRNLYFQLGLDLGFISKYKDVNSFLYLYPFVNAGAFIPVHRNFAFLAALGMGYMYSTHSFFEGQINQHVLALNVNIGLHIWNMINISYTLKTEFKSVSNLLSISYVYRIKR